LGKQPYKYKVKKGDVILIHRKCLFDILE